MSLARLQELAGRTCARIKDDVRGLLGGPGSSQSFSDTPSSGFSVAASRADHVHGMPAQPLDSKQDIETAFIQDEMIGDVGNGQRLFLTSPTVADMDDPGDIGGFGVYTMSTQAEINTLSSSTGILWGAPVITSLTSVDIIPHRFSTLFARVRPVLLTANLPLISFVIGAFGAPISGNGGALSNRDISAIDSGMFFRLVTDAQGQGTYEGVFVNSGNESNVSLGVSPRESGGSILFERFKITKQKKAISFFINDMNTPAGTLKSNFPAGTNGWGIMLENESPKIRTLAIDTFALRVKAVL